MTDTETETRESNTKRTAHEVKRISDRASAFHAAMERLTNGDSLEMTALIDEAGLNRSRFYRLFNSMEDFWQELGIYVVMVSHKHSQTSDIMDTTALNEWFATHLGAARGLLGAVGYGLTGLKIRAETGVSDARPYVDAAARRAMES